MLLKAHLVANTILSMAYQKHQIFTQALNNEPKKSKELSVVVSSTISAVLVRINLLSRLNLRSLTAIRI